MAFSVLVNVQNLEKSSYRSGIGWVEKIEEYEVEDMVCIVIYGYRFHEWRRLPESYTLYTVWGDGKTELSKRPC